MRGLMDRFKLWFRGQRLVSVVAMEDGGWAAFCPSCEAVGEIRDTYDRAIQDAHKHDMQCSYRRTY
jgi:hypothetical protein